ncbi:GNAT family N-acetyltransferase [Cohnella soli]|uniref:GNAT family N-acetyltransferase n=1 Tax=Cohnella soli TaxID=425005 RepID=A0ABW0HM32_9BACL
MTIKRTATIRPSEPRDSASLAELVVLAIGGIANKLTGEKEETKVLSQLESWINEVGNRFSCSCYLVCEASDGVAGMILCYSGVDEENLNAPVLEHLRQVGNPLVMIDREADEDEYYIDALAVRPAHQGKGIASALIEAAELRAAELGHPKISLNVDFDNDGARRLYERLGYEAGKRIEINGKPFRHMVKRLR